MPPQKDSKYRDDEVTWLSGDERGALGALSQFLRDTLGSLFFELFAARDGSNKQLLLRPEDYHSNAMLSVYSSDRGGFVKHLDHDNASDPRKISAVYYLNSDWDDKENGGALLLYPSTGTEGEGKNHEEVVRVNPIRDRLVLFWSDKMYHAVEPSVKKNRLACSFWYL
jgi:hypoxia-inducible factor (prolyl hydroxylase)